MSLGIKVIKRRGKIALTMGVIDMAFGNLFGSNLFDMAILGFDDVFYTQGILTIDVSANHEITAVAAMTMTAVAVVGLTYRATRKTLFLAFDSWGIVAVYVLATVIIYVRR